MIRHRGGAVCRVGEGVQGGRAVFSGWFLVFSELRGKGNCGGTAGKGGELRGRAGLGWSLGNWHRSGTGFAANDTRVPFQWCILYRDCRAGRTVMAGWQAVSFREGRPGGCGRRAVADGARLRAGPGNDGADGRDWGERRRVVPFVRWLRRRRR